MLEYVHVYNYMILFHKAFIFDNVSQINLAHYVRRLYPHHSETTCNISYANIRWRKSEAISTGLTRGEILQDGESYADQHTITCFGQQ